jgi:transposase-like protein
MLNFSGRWYSKEIIMQALRFYLSYSLSYRDVEEIMTERGAAIDHSTIQRWVERYAKDLEMVFRNNYRKHKVYVSWRMDETYVKHKGKWVYLYRAIDKEGDTLEFMVSEKRDEAAATKFFKKAIGEHGLPEKVTVDKSGANEAALIHLNCMLCLLGLWPHVWIDICQMKFLNNRIEQNHRNIKRRTNPMLGFKSWGSMESTIAGYELINMLRKGQHIHAENMTIYEQFYELAA